MRNRNIKHHELNKYVQKSKKTFEAFMGNETLPPMRLIPRSATELIKNPAWATVTYDLSANKFTLEIYEDIADRKVVHNVKHILYHEFTHALDINRLCAGDKNKYSLLRGYLEYHAAQIEIMALIGAQRQNDKVSFSMLDSITDIDGKKTVFEYMNQGMETTFESFNRPDFKTSLAREFHTVGTLYNHLGRTSICRLCSTDYSKFEAEINNHCLGATIFGDETWMYISKAYSGIMNDESLVVAGDIYINTLIKLFKQNGIQP